MPECCSQLHNAHPLRTRSFTRPPSSLQKSTEFQLGSNGSGAKLASVRLCSVSSQSSQNAVDDEFAQTLSNTTLAISLARVGQKLLLRYGLLLSRHYRSSNSIQQFESRFPPMTNNDKHTSLTACTQGIVSFCLWLLAAHQNLT